MKGGELRWFPSPSSNGWIGMHVLKGVVTHRFYADTFQVTDDGGPVTWCVKLKGEGVYAKDDLSFFFPASPVEEIRRGVPEIIDSAGGLLMTAARTMIWRAH